MPRMAKGGSGIASGRLAGVAAVQVVEDLFRLIVGERRAEALLHLLDRLLPRGPIHRGRVARYVLEAVAQDAAAGREVAPRSVLQPDVLLARTRRPQHATRTRERQRHRHRPGPCPAPQRAASHTISTLTLCTMLSC